MTRLPTTLAALLLLAAPALAQTQEPIKIGVIYPLTGPAASAGTALRDAIEVATSIVNTPSPELSALAAGAGMPNLGGRKVEPVFADHQGNPATAQNQALRLITQDHVVGFVGAYQSSATLTASAVAERYGVPYVAGEASAPSLTERGFQWFFRTTPIGTDFGISYASYLSTLPSPAVHSVALVNENTEYGTSTGEAIIKALTAKGLTVAPHIAYAANSTDVSAQVLQLKQANPDAVIFVSYTSDSIQFIKTMRNLDYKPPVLIGDDSGFSDTAFITAVGDLAEGAINRSSFDAGKPGSAPFRINEAYKAKSGHALDDTSARGLESFLVLCDAINRAGSTDPAKIQAALKATSLKPEQLMIGYNGIHFDAHGQNDLASTLLVQLRDRTYLPIWPAPSATTQAILPFQGWSK